MSTLERTRLLIIDDWGPEPLTAEQRRDLLEIVDDRYEKGSLLITSQIPIGRWHEVTRHLRVDPRRQHLVIGGPTGIGKSWLACALGHKACREGLSVLYRRASRLFAELATARGEGRLSRLMSTLERTRLLIIDDWGPEPPTAEQRRDLLEIVDDRSRKDRC